MAFDNAINWGGTARDPNNGHTWALRGNGTGGLSVGCETCSIWMTDQSLARPCDKPHADFEPPRDAEPPKLEPVKLDPGIAAALQRGYDSGVSFAQALGQLDAHLAGFLSALNERAEQNRRAREKRDR